MAWVFQDDEKGHSKREAWTAENLVDGCILRSDNYRGGQPTESRSATCIGSFAFYLLQFFALLRYLAAG